MRETDETRPLRAAGLLASRQGNASREKFRLDNIAARRTILQMKFHLAVRHDRARGRR
jgi:hypothetical protein